MCGCLGKVRLLACEVCVPHLPAALGSDIARAAEFPPSRCAVALGKHLCSAWEIRSDLQMDAELSVCWFQRSPKRQGEVDAGNLSPVIVLFCPSDI